jgi:hypothetical protein
MVRIGCYWFNRAAIAYAEDQVDVRYDASGNVETSRTPVLAVVTLAGDCVNLRGKDRDDFLAYLRTVSVEAGELSDERN